MRSLLEHHSDCLECIRLEAYPRDSSIPYLTLSHSFFAPDRRSGAGGDALWSLARPPGKESRRIELLAMPTQKCRDIHLTALAR